MDAVPSLDRETAYIRTSAVEVNLLLILTLLQLFMLWLLRLVNEVFGKFITRLKSATQQQVAASDPEQGHVAAGAVAADNRQAKSHHFMCSSGKHNFSIKIQ